MPSARPEAQAGPSGASSAPGAGKVWQGMQDLMTQREIRVLDLYQMLGGEKGAPISMEAFKRGLPVLGLRASTPEVQSVYTTLSGASGSSVGISYDTMRRNLRTPMPVQGSRSSLTGENPRLHADSLMHADPLSAAIVQSIGDGGPDTEGAMQAALILNNTRIMTILRSRFPNGEGSISCEEFKQVLTALGLHVSDGAAASLFNSRLDDGSGKMSVRAVAPGRLRGRAAVVLRRVEPHCRACRHSMSRATGSAAGEAAAEVRRGIDATPAGPLQAPPPRQGSARRRGWRRVGRALP